MLVREITRKSAQQYQKIDALRKKKQRLEERIERLEEKIHWTESLIRPIAKELAKEFPDYTYDICNSDVACQANAFRGIYKGLKHKFTG
jgi:chromosome segregation ATPase